MAFFHKKEKSGSFPRSRIFCAQTRFDRGVREAVAYIDAHPECQTPDEAFDRWCDETVEAYERLAQHLPRLNG